MPRPSNRSAHRLALAAILLASAAFQAAAAEPVGPRVEVAQIEIDLGQISRGATVEARFELRNVGDADLHILEAKPG
jgi:hypothetical protein